MKKSLVSGICILVVNLACAYEIDTRARITDAAFQRSNFSTTIGLFERLGLGKSRFRTQQANGRFVLNYSLGQKYYDPLKVGGADRYATAFDAENSWVMKAYRAPKPQRRWFYSQFDGRDEPYFPVDWMARGAVREDDTKALFACNRGEVSGDAQKHPRVTQGAHT